MKPFILVFEVRRKQETGSARGKQQLLLDQVFSVNPFFILFMINVLTSKPQTHSCLLDSVSRVPPRAYEAGALGALMVGVGWGLVGLNRFVGSF